MAEIIEPDFIDRDVQKIQSELIALYESYTGKTLQPAQPERLLINAFAYREGLIREAIQDAAVQNLVKFSSAPVLDRLGDLLGVVRLAAVPAKCTLRFTLVTGHGAVIIPAGTRVSSTDGVAVFVTTYDQPVAVGVNTVDIESECATVGTIGNGYLSNTITTILDPQAFIASATNTAATAGGSEQETDDGLRERIQLAPASFSNAGSKGAYIYHAKSAHPSIIDVAVTSPSPGQVNVYPLVEGGVTTPTVVLNAVTAALNDEKIRPLTDLVVVASPTKVDYNITANLTIYNTADATDVQARVIELLTEFAREKRLRMGRDIVQSQVIGVCMIDGVYSVSLASWSDVIINETQFPLCGTITVNISGTTNG